MLSETVGQHGNEGHMGKDYKNPEKIHLPAHDNLPVYPDLRTGAGLVIAQSDKDYKEAD